MNFQAEKSDMWPVKPAMYMWTNRQALPIQNKISKKQIMPKEDDKNCQGNINMRLMKLKMYSDKKCQESNLM